MTRTGRRISVASSLVLLAWVLAAGTAAAHPLGNFTTNTYLGLRISEDTIALDRVVDLAEVPALQAVQTIDRDGDGQLSTAETTTYAEVTCQQLATDLTVEVDGTRVPIRTVSEPTLTFPPGEAGLDTLRLECPQMVALEPRPAGHHISVTDRSFGPQTGWREITAIGDGTTLDSALPTLSASDRLTTYPETQLASPPDVRTAELQTRPGGGGGLTDQLPALTAAAPDGVVRGIDRISSWFTALVAVDQLTVPFAALALIVATGLGALHALAPGHGKTVMAAYLVGRQGTRRDAFLLGGTVAVTHTAGVFTLGVILTLTAAASPARIYPWLGAASGLLFAAVGVTLLRQARRTGGHLHGPGGHTHTADGRAIPWAHADHDHGDRHSHAALPDGPGTHEHGHQRLTETHDHATQAHEPHPGAERDVLVAGAEHPKTRVAEGASGHLHSPSPGRSNWRGLVAPGLAGGLVPSPSALLVLLAGFAIDRAVFGIVLVIAYGLGMAAALVGAGYLLLIARRRIERASRERRTRSERLVRVLGRLPILTSVMIIMGGLIVAIRSLASL